jgi:hypothetical protein
LTMSSVTADLTKKLAATKNEHAEEWRGDGSAEVGQPLKDFYLILVRNKGKQP